MKGDSKLSVSTKLRYNEYYNMQDTFDWLYDRSKKRETKGLDLYKIITSDENIMLAYRNIKSNTGSKTKGTDRLTISDYKVKDVDSYIKEIKGTLENYTPNSVRRVDIPKSNGKLRPLGIPTMRDRLIQQMFKQVLEPICEARFHNHSYGFRPNRSTHYAMSRCQHLINVGKLHHVVDIDIKGFFDNVNHKKLLKQMYDIGIKDERIISIVGKMLKAPIKGIGIQNKGTPQGGILSPLLSNIVLNEFDWWISNQWETFETMHNYSKPSHRNTMLKRNSKLKEMYVVRYADDFKLFTRKRETADKIYHGVKRYLKRNLKLEISTEKSKIINLRKNFSNFLGYKIKAKKKRKGYVANTYIEDSKKKKIKRELKERIKNIQKSPTAENVNKYNMTIIGLKNYFRYATHINIDANKIAYQLSVTLYNRLKSIGKYEIPSKTNKTYKKFNKNNYKTYKVAGLYLHPFADVQTKNVMNFKQQICNYTNIGREKHKELKPEIAEQIKRLMFNMYKYNTIELADNKLSVYSAQKGKCNILGRFLYANEVEFHHKVPKYLGGTDEYKNLVGLHKDVHMLIRLVDDEKIVEYKEKLNLNVKQIEKINKYREKCNLNNLV